MMYNYESVQLCVYNIYLPQHATTCKYMICQMGRMSRSEYAH